MTNSDLNPERFRVEHISNPNDLSNKNIAAGIANIYNTAAVAGEAVVHTIVVPPAFESSNQGFFRTLPGALFFVIDTQK